MRNKFLAGVCFTLVGLPVLYCIRDIIYSVTNATKNKIEVSKAKSDLELTRIDDQINFYNNMDDMLIEIIDEQNGRDY